jgi:hypothetical protein
MNTIKSTILSNIGTEITAINSEKGDSLLLPLVGAGSNYYLWDIDDVPAYPVAYLQEVLDEISIGIRHDTAVTYHIRLVAIIQEDATLNMPLLKNRYLRVLMTMINKYATKLYSEISITNVASALAVSQAGLSYQLAGVTFAVTIAF